MLHILYKLSYVPIRVAKILASQYPLLKIYAPKATELRINMLDVT